MSSLLAGGPQELARYSAGASILTDDRMALEFSGPRALHTSSAVENALALGSLAGGDSHASIHLDAGPLPSAAHKDEPSDTADHWQRRGAMMFKADAYASAYRDYLKALTLDFANQPALDGFVRSAVLAGRTTDAVAWMKGQTSTRPITAAQLVAISKLLASNSLGADAARYGETGSPIVPGGSGRLRTTRIGGCRCRRLRRAR